MPHNPQHDSDFDNYASTRAGNLRLITRLQFYLRSLQTVVKATPKSNQEAGYLDLDNAQELRMDLRLIDEALVVNDGWERLELEQSRLGVK